MKHLAFEVKCFNCGMITKVPFLEDLKAIAIEEWDMAEQSAQEELLNLHHWLANISLWGLIKFWLKRFKVNVKVVN